MALLADDTLRFHLFDNTRGTVIADAELTLNPGNRRFALLGHKVDCLIEQRIQLFPAVEQGGSLPRKTFSMGEAHEKRFYLECRKITMG